MNLTIYNTLSRREGEFSPLKPGKVKMYVCGPTVYDLLHIGNFRGAVFFNLVRNWLEYKGLKVTYVYNYTDVDDKIIERAKKDGVSAGEISTKYIAEFEKDFNRLGLKPHDHNPKVTDYMEQIIAFVADLVEKKCAYVLDGEVFYSVDSFKNYGHLSGKKLEDLIAGQRVEEDKRKRNPADFVLWKPSKEGEPSWDSPWGLGRPGWHIECSAMIRAILGETIDIHGGGIDLIFPHHENEVAQGEGRTGKPYCKYWMHNNFINFKDQKMSKSLGNVVSARDFMDLYHPEILKYVMLSAHYRTVLSFNDDKIENAIGALARVYSALKDAAKKEGKANKEILKAMQEADQGIEESMSEDFNSPKALAHIFEVVRTFNRLQTGGAAFSAWIKKYGSMMALFGEETEDFLNQLDKILLKQKNIDPKEVEKLIAKRLAARAEKNWEKADSCRDKLTEMGIEIHDSKGKTTWEVKKK